MPLPSFLVIGAQRAGTTLLHRILEAHGEIYVPSRRKEVHYFDWYYDRGPAWYARFFPEEEAASCYSAIGEVTPDYIFEPAAPHRIQSTLPGCRFIVSLRNPVDRAYSWYLYSLRSFNEQRSFGEFLDQEIDVLERGRYSHQIERYFALFPREFFLFLIYEELVKDPAAQLDALASFLGLKSGWADPSALIRERVNASDIPRFRAAYARAQRFGEVFTRHDLDWVVKFARRLGIPGMFGAGASKPRLSERDRRRLEAYYDQETPALEELLGRDLTVWRPERRRDTAGGGLIETRAKSCELRPGLPAANP